MIRTIIGSLIGIFGLMGFATEISNYQHKSQWDLIGLFFACLFISIGVCLIISGILSGYRKRKLFEMAYSMYRKDKSIDVLHINTTLKVSEFEIRKEIKKAQSSGVFPEDAEII